MMNPGHGRGPGSGGGSSSGRKTGDVVSDQFPAGLRVLVVDDDPTCLMILERMLRNCLYEVTKCNRAEIALSLLRKNKNGFDIVISDVHMPDMDGFKLLEHVGLEMDLPVIMMSADDSKNVVMKGVVHGACDYLIKPVRMEALKNIWQHVVRKRRNEWNIPEHSGSIEEVSDRSQQKAGEEADNNSSSVNEGNWRNSRKRKDEEVEEPGEEKEDTSTLKKPRVVWSVELHQQFVAAVNQLGVDKAVPKKILELMNVPGLTRENVASHLQKYRIYLRRLGGVSQHQGNLNNSFMTPQDANFGPLSSLNGFDLQALAVAGQIPAQSLAQLQAAGLARPTVSKPGISVSPLVDQRNIFSFDNPKIRFGDGQPPQLLNGNKQMNLLHGIPTGMEPKQLTSLGGGMSLQQIAAARAGQNVQSSAMLMPVSQQQPQPRGPPMHASLGQQPILPNNASGRSGISDTGSGRNIPENSRGLPAAYNALTQHPAASMFNNFPLNQNPELPGNSFPLASAPGISIPVSKGGASYQEEVSSSDVKGSAAGFTPSYDIFNELQQHNKPQDWDLRNVGLAFDARQDTSAAFSVSEGYSSSTRRNGQSVNGTTANLQPSMGQQNLNQLYTDSSVRVKSERVSEAGLFPEQYNQEDLMSALLKQEGIAPAENEFDFDGYSIDNIPV